MDARNTLQQLAALLDSRAETGSTMRLDEAQAFLLALISGPDPVDAALWLPEILAEEHLFDDAEQQNIATLLTAWTDSMRAQMQQGQMPDLLLYADEEGGTDYYTWCNAYLYAIDIAPSDWFTEQEDEGFEDLFYPVMALGGVYDATDDEPALIDIDDTERRDLQQQLPESLLAIYRYWRAKTNKPQTLRRQGPKTGRNEPCPCGSGKKYKACCGA
nr:YecA family protein [Neisseria sp. HSC-16F19]